MNYRVFTGGKPYQKVNPRVTNTGVMIIKKTNGSNGIIDDPRRSRSSDQPGIKAALQGGSLLMIA